MRNFGQECDPSAVVCVVDVVKKNSLDHGQRAVRDRRPVVALVLRTGSARGECVRDLQVWYSLAGIRHSYNVSPDVPEEARSAGESRSSLSPFCRRVIPLDGDVGVVGRGRRRAREAREDRPLCRSRRCRSAEERDRNRRKRTGGSAGGAGAWCESGLEQRFSISHDRARMDRGCGNAVEADPSGSWRHAAFRADRSRLTGVRKCCLVPHVERIAHSGQTRRPRVPKRAGRALLLILYWEFCSCSRADGIGHTVGAAAERVIPAERRGRAAEKAGFAEPLEEAPPPT
jgi:hypothetical protein